MLSEIFFLRLEAQMRASREAAQFAPHPAAVSRPRYWPKRVQRLGVWVFTWLLRRRFARFQNRV
jgi:hypothetical protein